MRFIPAVLLGCWLIWPDWCGYGRGVGTKVAQLSDELGAQKAANEDSSSMVARLEAEIGDLREGLDMVEDRARSELGMVKPNEILVQIAR